MGLCPHLLGRMEVFDTVFIIYQWYAKKKIDKIKSQLRDDNIEEAFASLSKIVTDNQNTRELILQSGKFNFLLRQDRLGLISFEQLKTERNKLRKSILDLVLIIEKDLHESPFPRYDYKNLILPLFIGAAIFLSLYFVYSKYAEHQRNTLNKKKIEVVEKYGDGLDKYLSVITEFIHNSYVYHEYINGADFEDLKSKYIKSFNIWQREERNALKLMEHLFDTNSKTKELTSEISLIYNSRNPNDSSTHILYLNYLSRLGKDSLENNHKEIEKYVTKLAQNRNRATEVLEEIQSVLWDEINAK